MLRNLERKLTLRVARLLAVHAVISDFFMVTPAIKSKNIRCYNVSTLTCYYEELMV